ncbi:hypothetical protein TARUN_4627 [Trichoderma arundinaceum]|uniref:Uncharacterized protein n=1 Tax=Trichoderma arundinaceum TaxID=490622 RepID=A0A395NNN1_TRIAR|nr:hypothetical protein TARUN_4627 [Trichoderma arundinaceum]
MNAPLAASCAPSASRLLTNECNPPSLVSIPDKPTSTASTGAMRWLSAATDEAVQPARSRRRGIPLLQAVSWVTSAFAPSRRQSVFPDRGHHTGHVFASTQQHLDRTTIWPQILFRFALPGLFPKNTLAARLSEGISRSQASRGVLYSPATIPKTRHI